MVQVQVNTDELLGVSGRLSGLAEQGLGLSVNIGALNLRAQTFIANWVSLAGREACSLISDAQSHNVQLAHEVARLGGCLERAAANYQRTEEFAQDALRQYESGGLATGWTSSWGKPQRQGSDWFDGLQEIGWQVVEKYPMLTLLGYPLFNAETMRKGVSYLAAINLFGYRKFMDAKSAFVGGAVQKAVQAQKVLVAAGAWVSREMLNEKYALFAGAVISVADGVLDRNHINENLNHSEVVTAAPVANQAQEVVIPRSWEDIAHNLAVASSTDDRVDELMHGEGRFEKYQGVIVQVVRNADGTETAFVYITGTEFDNSSTEGAPTSAVANVDELNVENDASLAEGTASMQLVEEALRHAGVAPGAGLVLAGFSKGASTAVNFAHNSEMQKKYQMKAIFDMGGPTGLIDYSDQNIPHYRLTEARDLVPLVGGSLPRKERRSTQHLSIDQEALEGNREFMTHGADKYHRYASQDSRTQEEIPLLRELTEGAVAVGGPTVVAGTTQNPHTPALQMMVEGTAKVGAAAGEVLSYVNGERVPEDIWKIPYDELEDRDYIPDVVGENGIEFSVGSQEYSHLDIQIDDGTVDIEFDPGAEESSMRYFERTEDIFDRWFPDAPEGYPGVPSSSQWELPEDDSPAGWQRVGGITFTPASPQYAGVGGNF